MRVFVIADLIHPNVSSAASGTDSVIRASCWFFVTSRELLRKPSVLLVASDNFGMASLVCGRSVLAFFLRILIYLLLHFADSA